MRHELNFLKATFLCSDYVMMDFFLVSGVSQLTIIKLALRRRTPSQAYNVFSLLKCLNKMNLEFETVNVECVKDNLESMGASTDNVQATSLGLIS